MNNAVLYYPSIEFKFDDYDWLIRASLFWDEIYRIVPEGYVPEDDVFIKILCSSGEIGKHYTMNIFDSDRIHENEFYDKTKHIIRSEACKKFLQDFEPLFKHYRDTNLEWESELVRLNTTKLEFHLFEKFAEYGLIANYPKEKWISPGEWIYVPKVFADAYMSYLAKEISEKDNLSLATPNSISWLSSYNFKSATSSNILCSDAMEGFICFPVYIYDVLPLNKDFSPYKILEFREKRKDERHNFMQALNSFLESLSSANSVQRIADIWNNECNEIKKAIKDYKKSSDILGAVRWGGRIGACASVLIDVGTLKDRSSSILSLVGAGIDLLGLGASFLADKFAQKNNAYSYLCQLQDLLPNKYRYQFSINPLIDKYLWNEYEG